MANAWGLRGANASGAQCAAGFNGDAWKYWIDACQRGFLFLDVLQQRSERYQEHAAKVAPHVLKFDCKLIMDGRKLPQPVNYALVRIVPPDGIEIHSNKRPFVIVDPRAGHGPGIGGFKPQSEVLDIPPSLLPKHPTLDNFRVLFEQLQFGPQLPSWSL